MRFGYTILYVRDVAASVAFYEQAFGLARRFVHDSGTYAEMETGATTLAFASEGLAEANGLAIRSNTLRDPAAGFELGLVSDDPAAGYARAIAAGATAVVPVKEKPWGQKVGYVRDLDGCLVEICSPMGGNG